MCSWLCDSCNMRVRAQLLMHLLPSQTQSYNQNLLLFGWLCDSGNMRVWAKLLMHLLPSQNQSQC